LKESAAQVTQQTTQDVLKAVPSDALYMFAINMQRFAQSPLYPRIMRNKEPLRQMISAVESFSFSTGVDLGRDVSFLILSSTKQGAPLMIATGQFDRERISKYLQCSMIYQEKQYNGATFFIFPREAGGRGIAFINQQLIAVGDPESIKLVVDVSAGKKKNILSDPKMVSTIGSGPSDETIWFAGRIGSVLRNASIPYSATTSSISGTFSSTGPIMVGSSTVAGSSGSMTSGGYSSMGSLIIGSTTTAVKDPYVTGVQGVLNITDAIVGNFSLTSENEGKAKQVATIWDSSSEFKKRPPDPVSALMSQGLTVNQSGPKVELSLNIALSALEKFLKQNNPQESEALKAPVPFLKPMPPYTEEALKAQISGTMQVELIVRKDGTPENIKIVKGMGYGMDQTAIAIIKDFWRFYPALRDNKPIEAKTAFDLPFKPKDNRWK
jgi:TonB family protein